MMRVEDTALRLERAALDRLMPMHLTLTPTGHIRHAGPTLAKLATGEPLIGRRFLEAFELRRPRHITTMAELVAAAGARLTLQFRDPPRTALKGLAVPIAGRRGGLLVNLSFGISAVDAVGTYALSSADFPPTDLTVEMLYLVEAKEAVLDESRSLNRRLQGAKIAAEEQAFTDTLTGLKNRRAMDHILARYVSAELPFGVMHVDLDYFKEVNDSLGHAAGDHVLQEVARILVDETRDDDTVARVGGDEFVLIFPRLAGRDRLAALARRILARLDAPISFAGAPCRVSASIGITLSEAYDHADVEEMLADADRALYRSKNEGRARYSFTEAALAVPEPAGTESAGPCEAQPVADRAEG